jgi:hypothetical protein
LDEAGEQEAEEVASGLIGPVRVLDDEQYGRGGSKETECAEYRLEQFPAIDPVAFSARGPPGQEPGDGGVFGNDAVGECAVVGGDAGERLAERQIRRRRVAEVDAMADENERVALGRGGYQFR